MTEEIIERKQSALSTLLDMLDVPTLRKDVTKPANLRWLSRNLRINNGEHAMCDTTMGLVIWLLKETR